MLSPLRDRIRAWWKKYIAFPPVPPILVCNCVDEDGKADPKCRACGGTGEL